MNLIVWEAEGVALIHYYLMQPLPKWTKEEAKDKKEEEKEEEKEN